MAPVAPAAARVEDVFFQRGEWASANQPVVALIPDDRVYVHFFVPETAVAAYKPRQKVGCSFAGYPDALSATLVYVPPRPQLTQPSLDSPAALARLVFFVEAKPPTG